MKRKSVLRLGIILMILMAAACDNDSDSKSTSPSPTPETRTTLIISGAGGVQPVLSAVKPAFENDTPGYHLDILAGSGTDGGVRGVTEGTLTVAAMARPPKDAELEAAPSLQYVEFGRGGQALLVHPKVGVTALTTGQAVDILTGKTTNWSEVGGPDMKIVVFVRDENDSSTKAIRRAFFGENTFATTAQILTSQSDMGTAVASTPGSIGFGTWPAMLALGNDLASLALDGVGASDPAYPILEPLGVGFLAEQKDIVQPFVDWLLSDKGKTALAAYGVLPPAEDAPVP